jgi:hypothetical protein
MSVSRRLPIAVLVLAMVFFYGIPTFAQQGSSNRQEGIGVQVVGGPTFNSVLDSEGLDVQSQAGYLVGLSFGGNRGGRVGVGADVLFGKQRLKVGDDTLSQNVVHVPVMVKVNLGQRSANGVSVFALGGGYYNWEFGGKVNDLSLSEDTNGHEFGWTAGAGVEVLRMSIQGRYLRGLKTLDKTFKNAEDSKSQAVVVLVGFRLN